jgi:hypothetical protein
MAEANFILALRDLLTELLDGPPSNSGFVLNPGDAGLLRSLAKLSSGDASAIPAGGGASIAAHVDHVRYGFELLNRWAAGEKNPYADADWSKSWERLTVSDQQWASLQDALRREAYAAREAMQKPRDLSEIELKGVIGIVVHLAYHMGAIRQINRATRGPSAND